MRATSGESSLPCEKGEGGREEEGVREGGRRKGGGREGGREGGKEGQNNYMIVHVSGWVGG